MFIYIKDFLLIFLDNSNSFYIYFKVLKTMLLMIIIMKTERAAQLFQVCSIVRPKTKFIIHTLLSTEKNCSILIISTHIGYTKGGYMLNHCGSHTAYIVLFGAISYSVGTWKLKVLAALWMAFTP